MTLRLYMDEDAMDRHLVRAVRARGIDILTALEVGMIERTDEEHLWYAAREGRVLYTFNVGDFHQLHTAWIRSGKVHAGIILARQQRYTVTDQTRRLLKIIGARSSEAMRNQIEFLSAWK